MRASILLGLRLAGGGAGPARLRTASVALAAAIGTLVMLLVVAAVRGEQARSTLLGDSESADRLMLAVVLSVALPILVLASTAGRLSAELRDRRLANLRLLGMTQTQTRLVAVSESGVAAALGSGLGWLGFWLARPFVSVLDVGGGTWTVPELTPRTSDQLWVVVAVVLGVVAVGSLPHRLDMPTVLRRARRADTRRPSLLRLLPLAAGAAVLTYMIGTRSPGTITDAEFLVLLVGALLLAVGLVLVVPALVRLLADVVLRLAPGPAGTVAGRRLQAQPAGVTRVVAALLVGLFLVTGARAVVVAFESTPQYQEAARQIEVGQRVPVIAAREEATELADRAAAVGGVDDVLTVQYLTAGDGCLDGPGPCLRGLVATCAELRRLAPGLTGCRKGEPMWLDADDSEITGVGTGRKLDWFAEADYGPLRHHGPLASLPPPTRRIAGDVWTELAPFHGTVLIPPSAIDVSHMPARADVTLVVLGGPGRGLAADLGRALGVTHVAYSTFEDYDFVAGLRALTWTIAAVILSVGLLTLAIAGVDRAVARRREMVSLQLLGVPPQVIRRAQWIEAALPIAVGTVLAIGLGFLAGATYLSLGLESVDLPWAQSLTLGAVAVASAFLIAGLTVLAASPRLRPDLIRTE